MGKKIKRPRQISLIGLGNIGSKLTLNLVEEGIKIKQLVGITQRGK